MLWLAFLLLSPWSQGAPLRDLDAPQRVRPEAARFNRPKVLLKEAAVAPETAGNRCGPHIERLDVWALANDFGPVIDIVERTLRTGSEELDSIGVEYLQHLYDEQAPKSWAGTVLSALQDRYPRLKAHKLLPACWRAHNAWESLEPGEFRKPWPPCLVQGLSTIAVSQNRPEIAGFLMCASHALLRPGEAGVLKAEEVSLPEELPLSSSVGVLVVEKPKTRGKFARTQHVLLDDAGIVDMIRQLKGLRRGSELLFCSYAVVYRWTRTILGVLNLPQYTLGGLRSGGATFHWLSLFRLDVLRRRGRWVSDRSLEHYVQEAVSALAQAGWDKGLEVALEQLSRWLRPLFNKCTKSFFSLVTVQLRRHRGGGGRRG